jgi:hypothetical protein
MIFDAASEVGKAVSILTTYKARIIQRLISARDDALSHVKREDIPEHLRQRFDQVMAQVSVVDSLTEDEGMVLATMLADLSTSLDDELRE